MKKILLFLHLYFILSSCGENENYDQPQEENLINQENQLNAELEKEEIKLSLLSKLSITIENGGSTPTLIGSLEFSEPSPGKLMFNGENLRVNKQYVYYKNNNNYILGLKDWVTEMGELSEVNIVKNGNIPEIKAKWKGTKGLVSGQFLIRPILEGTNANRFYYELYSSKWKVWGYNDNMTQNEFNEILSQLNDFCGIQSNENVKSNSSNKEKENVQGDYLKYSDVCIKDVTTNSYWFIAPDKGFNYEEAVDYAKKINERNLNWRVPTFDEIKKLYNKDYSAGEGFFLKNRHYPAKIHSSFDAIGSGSWFWVSDRNDNSSKSYAINFYEGIRVSFDSNNPRVPVHLLLISK